MATYTIKFTHNLTEENDDTTMYIVRYSGTNNEYYLAVFQDIKKAIEFARKVSGYITEISNHEIYSEKGFIRQ